MLPQSACSGFIWGLAINRFLLVTRNVWSFGGRVPFVAGAWGVGRRECHDRSKLGDLGHTILVAGGSTGVGGELTAPPRPTVYRVAAARTLGRLSNWLWLRERKANSRKPQLAIRAGTPCGSGRVSQRRNFGRQSGGPGTGRSDALGAPESLWCDSQVRPAGSVAANRRPIVSARQQRQ